MGIHKEHFIEGRYTGVNSEAYTVGSLKLESALEVEGLAINDAGEERKMYENAAKVAFPRFSEVQHGEHITTRELRMRMSEIGKTGYKFGKGYSKLNRSQLWDLLGEVRRDIRANLK